MAELLGFSLLRPWWLLGLIPAPLLLVLLYRHGWQRSAWEQLLPRPLQAWLLQRPVGSGHKLRFTALGISWTLAILALAGPALETRNDTQRVEDRALVIVLDLSHNMLSNDLPPHRLERARLKIRNLMQDYADSQISLIVYAGSAHRVTPLSNDHATLSNLLSALDPAIMPIDGQALGSAMDMARQAIEPLPRSNSQVLLVTSGLDSAAQLQLAEHAAHLGPQLSILGVGTRSGAPVPLAEGGFLRDAEGRILLPRLNSQQLTLLARQAGARYHNITVGDRDLDYLLQPLQSSTRGVASEQRSLTDQGHWLVLLLLPIAALGARRGWLGLLLCAALLPMDANALSWADLWQRADQQAMQLLREQQPADAAERFRDPAWRAWALHQAGDYQQAADAWATLALTSPDDPEQHFNRGTALAMTGDYPAALEAYEHSLTLAPNHHGARHNRKVVEDYLEQLRQQQDPQQAPGEDAPEDGQKQNGESNNGSSQTSANSAASSPTSAEDQTQQAPGADPGATAGTVADSNSEPGNTEPNSTASSSTNPSSEPTPHPVILGESRGSTADQSPHQPLQHQQPLEHWLQEIPDNPAELLRRKFLYQHLQQQDVSP